MRLDWKAVVGILITVGSLWWVLHGVDFAAVWAVVKDARWGYLLAAVAVATSGFLWRALRWKVLLAPVKRDTTLRSRFAAVNIGFMANNVLPARVGEFARAYALSRLEPVSVSAAFGSLVVERFLDGVVLMAFLLLAASAPSFPAGASVRSGPMGEALQGFAVVLVVGVAALFFMLRWPGTFIRLVERVVARLPGDFARPLVDALEAFLESLEILRRPGLLFLGFAWTVGFWAFNATSFWLGMEAFAIHKDYVASVFVEAVVAFGVAVPSAPGFFGTFHAAADWALNGVYGVEAPRALAFAFGYHLGGFIPVTVIGLWYAWRMGLSLKDVELSESRVEKAVERTHPEAAVVLGEKGATWRGEQPPVAPVVITEPPGGPIGAAPGEALGVEVAAPAKVNLLLRVGPLRPDGYHDLDTVFQAVDLCDRVRVWRGPPGVTLQVEGRDVPGPAEENLAVRAARAFAAEAGVEPAWRVVLEKRIPAGAGLGGGSSDAAATLRALERLEGEPLGARRLSGVGRRLGADVAFFLEGAARAAAAGRGDDLRPMEPLPAAELVLALPDVHVGTAEAYRALDAGRGRDGAVPTGAPERPGDWPGVARAAVNDFEAVVPARHPEVARALEALRTTGATFTLLAGSGGACFAAYPSADAADRAAARVREAHPWLEVVRARTLEALPAPRSLASPDDGDEGPGAAGG